MNYISPKTMTRRLIRTDERGRCVRGRYAAFMRDGIGMVWRPYGGSDEVAMPSDRIWEMVGYAPGDRLWVRETWAMPHGFDMADAKMTLHRFGKSVIYRATDNPNSYSWRPGIHMPRWASRLTLTVTDVRVQRLQDMDGQHPSESDAIAEGVRKIHHGDGNYYYSAFRDEPHAKNWCDPTDAFRELWDSINGKREGASWNDNPWVVALSFCVERKNIDAVERAPEVAA